MTAQTKIYVEGKTRAFHVTDAIADVATKLDLDMRLVEFQAVDRRTGEVEPVFINPAQVVTATPIRDARQLSGSEFWGKKFTIRGLGGGDIAELRGPLGIAPARCEIDLVDGRQDIVRLDGKSIDNYAIVIGEDLGEAEIAIVEVATGRVVWCNPAEPDESVQAIVRAVQALAASLAATDEQAEEAGRVENADDLDSPAAQARGI